MGEMDHKYALCRKLDAHCVRRSITLLEENPDPANLEWLEIDQQAEPIRDKKTEILDVTKQKVNGKYQITYAKRLMTAKELSEKIV